KYLYTLHMMKTSILLLLAIFVFSCKNEMSQQHYRKEWNLNGSVKSVSSAVFKVKDVSGEMVKAGRMDDYVSGHNYDLKFDEKGFVMEQIMRDHPIAPMITMFEFRDDTLRQTKVTRPKFEDSGYSTTTETQTSIYEYQN